LSEYFDTKAAREAGFFDELVSPTELLALAQSKAKSFQDLDMRAHTASKRRIRGSLIRYVRRNVPVDVADAALFGLRTAMAKKKA
ncbi:MAG: hypothetical protein ACSHXK_12055, partial [Oceanococcus sp.]